MKHKRSIISLALATIMLVSLCAVASTTSVSAANSNSRASTSQTQPAPVSAPLAADNTSKRATVKATPDLVGAPIAAGTGPAACVLNGSTDMYVFVQGYDGALWYRIWDTSVLSWEGGWVSLGGQIAPNTSPAATSSVLTGAPEMLVFVRGTNGAVYYQDFRSGSWYGWFNLGGQVAPGTGPAASTTLDRLDVFVEGTNGALYNKTWSNGGWGNWQNRGGQLTSSPNAIYRDGYIEVLVRGTNGQVYDDEYSTFTSSWVWYNFGGNVAPGTGPAVCAYGSASTSTSRLDIFVEGTNGALYNKTWIQGTGWSPSWTKQGGGLSASPTAATFTRGGSIDIEVFVRGTNGLIYQKEFYNKAWQPWLPGISGPP